MHRFTSIVVLLSCGYAYAAAPSTPVVNSTLINYIANQITIGGQNFSPSGVAPTVLFNGVSLAPGLVH